MKKIVLALIIALALPALAFAAPSITLYGPNPVSVQQGTNYQEPGYQANDALDGNITGSVNVSGAVDTNVSGDYALTYSVTNSSLETTSVSRGISVAAGGGGNPCTSVGVCPCPESRDFDQFGWTQCVLMSYPKNVDGSVTICRLNPHPYGDTTGPSCAPQQNGFGVSKVFPDGRVVLQ